MRWETIPSGAAPPPDDHRPPGDARSSLDLFMAPLRGLLVDDRVTEICINRPHEAYVQRPAGWSREKLAFASFQWCLLLAKLVASVTRQRLSPAEPLLAATLADGARIQIVVPPATEEGTVSITIRRPSQAQWTLEQLRERRVFTDVRVVPTPAPDALAASSRGDPHAQELTSLLLIRDFVSFLRHAVRSRMNILLSGVHGSGKTTLAKALLMEVPPEDRLVTIEDVRELSLRNQPNHVRMFCGNAIPGAPPVTAAQLLATARRQGPDRVFLSELRGGDEVCDYLSMNNAHPGSIACVQADGAELAFVALAQLMKRSDGGRGMTTREGVELAQSSIDIVVHCSRRSHRHRCVGEIWYDPAAKRRAWS